MATASGASGKHAIPAARAAAGSLLSLGWSEKYQGTVLLFRVGATGHDVHDVTIGDWLTCTCTEYTAKRRRCFHMDWVMEHKLGGTKEDIRDMTVTQARKASWLEPAMIRFQRSPFEAEICPVCVRDIGKGEAATACPACLCSMHVPCLVAVGALDDSSLLCPACCAPCKDALEPSPSDEQSTGAESPARKKPNMGSAAAPAQLPGSLAPEEAARMPKVVRLRRSKGVVVQGCDVYIGRRCTLGGWRLQDSKWHNPFSIKDSGSSAAAVAKFRAHILAHPDLLDALPELEGKSLGCWCKPAPCHGDILLELFRDRVLGKGKAEKERAAAPEAGADEK